jgi:outer membrane immunogenic protein
MKRLIIGVTAALMLSGPAFADGMPSKGHHHHHAAAPKWSGIYVGLGIGAGAAVSELSADIAGVNLFSFDGFGSSGTFGTVTVGLDGQFGKMVAGVFVDYDFGSSISSDLSILAGLGGPTIPLIDFNNSWSIGARLGFLASSSTLIYGTAGYTSTDVEILGGVVPFFPDSLEGYFVGAGIETFLASRWTFKLEYRYTDYDTANLLTLGPLSVDLDSEVHSARAVLSYRFGGH